MQLRLQRDALLTKWRDAPWQIPLHRFTPFRGNSAITICFELLWRKWRLLGFNHDTTASKPDMSEVPWLVWNICPTMQRRIASEEPQSISSSGYSVHERPLPHHSWETELPRWTESCQPVLLFRWLQMVVKKVPVGDCWLTIATTETLKTWEKKEKDLDLQIISDSSDECVEKQLSGVLGNPWLVQGFR